jgi:glycosyltransferase involved in cell wall biosynthesis
LNSSIVEDFSAKSWRRKNMAFERLDTSAVHIVAPSKWLADSAQSSALLSKFPVSVIPYGIDTEVFQPRDKACARGIFGIPNDAQVILFVADRAGEKRKGLDLLVEALRELNAGQNVWFLMTGSGAVGFDLGDRVRAFEYIHDERMMSLLYSAANVFVAPSVQDNLPNTALEAMACGVPVVAFAAGGLKDLVCDEETGRLAPVGDVKALRALLKEVLSSPQQTAKMAEASRIRAISEYTLERQAERYISLYQKLLSGCGE